MNIDKNMFFLSNINNKNNYMNNVMNKLSTGLRINSASDDPAGLAISTKMNVRTSAYNVGSRNLNDASSMLQTAEGALESASDVLQRTRDLTLQASNGTLNASDKENIQTEINQLKSQYNDIMENTSFNGVKLLDNASAVNVNTGNGNMNVNTVDVRDINNGGTNANIDLSIDVTTNASSVDLAKIDSAIDEISTKRAEMGAEMNRLEYVNENNNNQMIQNEQSRSRIEDADMAKQFSDLVKNKVLEQSSIKMLQMKNSMQGNMLDLFE